MDLLRRHNTDPRLIGLAEVVDTAPKKPALAVRQVVDSMEAMEARLIEAFDARFGTQKETLTSKFAELQQQLDEQAVRLQQMQVKVDLSLDTLGKVQQERGLDLEHEAAGTDQAKAKGTDQAKAKGIHGPSPPPLAIPNNGAGLGVAGHAPGHTLPPQPPPRARPQQQLTSPASGPQVEFPPTTPIVRDVVESSSSGTDSGRRSNWVPKMDFPKFAGTDARIWIDQCHTFFELYQIPAGFRVAAATMYLREGAAHWYQSYKKLVGFHDWDRFCVDLLLEFECDNQRDKNRELLALKQTGSVMEYRRQFDLLVYQIRLYDPAFGGLMVVSHFVDGLKEELKAAVEIQMPTTVQQACLCAQVQEGVLARAQQHTDQVGRKDYGAKSYSGSRFEKGDLWKAKQLKDYRRANGLCFSCGEKYVPGHQCALQQPAQVKAMQQVEILSDEILDAITKGEDTDEEQPMRVSLHALSGTDHCNSIRLRALVGNKVILILIDSGSSHSFIDSALLDKLQCETTPVPSTSVEVANGQVMTCNKQVSNLSWWVQGHTFRSDLKVLDLGGYDAILGMDWLSLWGAMTCHWKEKWLQFMHHGELIKLQGLHNGPIVIQTDHKSLCYLEDQVLDSELQKEAMTKLIGLQYSFPYRKGVDHIAADALSRVGHFMQLSAVSVAQPIWLQEVLNSYEMDPAAQALLPALAISTDDHPRIGDAAYKLDLHDTCLIHLVFHVSQLKTFVPDHTPVFTSLPVPVELNADEVYPEEILERRLVKRGNAAHLQVQIKWANLPDEVATWEDYEVLRARFKTAPAWGHAGSQGGGNVTAMSSVHGGDTLKERKV